MSAIHGLLARIPVNLPFESLLVGCQKLYEKFPPCTIEKEAAEDIRKQKEERERSRPGAVVPAKSGTKLQMLTKIVIYTAPVLIGILVWRVIQQ